MSLQKLKEFNKEFSKNYCLQPECTQCGMVLLEMSSRRCLLARRGVFERYWISRIRDKVQDNYQALSSRRDPKSTICKDCALAIPVSGCICETRVPYRNTVH